MRFSVTHCGAGVLAIMAFFQATAANAGAISSWSWSSQISGVDVSGTADFSTVVDGAGFDLVIVVKNTADVIPQGTAEILTGLYFDLSSSAGLLSMNSAVADLGLYTSATSLQTIPTSGTAGTNVCAPGGAQSALAPGSGCTVDGGWELAYSATGIGGGASATQHWGIGTSGQTGAFNGNHVNSFDYGMAPLSPVGVNPAFNGGSGGLGGAYPPGYIAGQATFVLTGLTSGDVTVSNVSGAYGTAPEGTPAATLTITSVPEPASTGLFLAGVATLLAWRRNRQRR